MEPVGTSHGIGFVICEDGNASHSIDVDHSWAGTTANFFFFFFFKREVLQA